MYSARDPQNAAAFSEDKVHPDLPSLLDQMTDGILFLDRDWRISYVNRAGWKISRLEPQHMNGPTHWEVFPATAGTELERIYRRSMEERVSLEHEFFYDPFEIWLAVRTFPIPSGLAINYRDISRLKRAEFARDESSRRLEQVFESTTDAVVVLDEGYNFTFLNRRARELLAPSGDVLGKNLWTSFPGVVYENSPYVETYRRAMDKRIPGSFEAFYPEPLNVWLTVEARPSDGDGIIIFFRDITQQKDAAEALRRKSEEAERQAAEIEAVYRMAPIGLALFDAVEFRYLRLNDRQAAFFGLRPEQVVGQSLTQMAPIEGLRELFEQVVEGNPVINFPLEGELVSHPGEHRYWTVNYFPVYATDGSVQAISAASLEVTQQKKAELALIQSEKLAAVGRLASSISHEINNPLEAVTNLLYLIAGEGELTPGVREWVELAQAELARVSQIATQTLRFYRQAVRATEVSAEQLLRPVVDIFQGRLANSGITVEVEYRKGTQVLCLENEIRQVLSNLIGNALDAMRAGGRLVLRAREGRDWTTGVRGLQITVADTGQGMSASTMARIFEPFFTTKELNGTGLGMWISSEIVQRHDGRFRVRSSQDPMRHGTVFTLFLPLTHSPEPSA